MHGKVNAFRVIRNTVSGGLNHSGTLPEGVNPMAGR